nr:hypothetical protein [Tanacetum cinerariifolium]
MALTFADTHNMIAYLTKSDASEGFNQIIDFLNASSIQYALTVNHNIYVSCIKQFWSSVLVKKVNDVIRLQALIDRKKVIKLRIQFEKLFDWMMKRVLIVYPMRRSLQSWHGWDLNQLCGMKGIKREFSIPRTPQQNGVVERKKRTLIKAARTMLVDLLLPISFWAEVVNTTCYVQNRVLVDPLGKFDRKADEGFLVGYSSLQAINLTLEQFDAEKAGEENVQQYVLFPLWSSGSKDPQYTDDDVTFEVKESEFEVEKPESKVYVSPSSSAKTKKHDDKTKREANGKSLAELLTGYRILSKEFEDYSDNSINEVNAASTLVFAVGKISTNSINTFSAACRSYTAVSPTHRKSSYVDPSQYPDDSNMSALEDITYSEDEEDVGVEVDFTNLETTITVSPIPTTRVHKDHHVYVDDIIFGSTSKDLCKALEKLMKDKFQMSSTGELTFFLGLQVKQKQDGIFIIKDKYVAKILRKFGLIDGKSASTPIDTEKPLLKDPDGKDVDVHTYRSMIGSLMYLTSSTQDIMFAICACACF